MHESFLLRFARLLRKYLKPFLVVVLICVGGFLYLIQPPRGFPVGTIITVEDGETLTTVARELKTKHVVHSATILQDIIILFEGERKVIAGDYYLSKPEGLIDVAYRLTRGAYDLAPLRVTIPEGSTVHQIADIMSAQFPKFDKNDFIANAEAKEGYLFPDTYFYMPNVKYAEVIKKMSDTFVEKIAPLQQEILDSGRSMSDTIIIASILEEEAKTPEDWGLVSGIIQKRLSLGMPLQVDATLGYITGKASSELTTADLKIDSPYNSYANKGLPPTPISNPGVETLVAAIKPTTSPYLYFLSDENDIMHYAKTLEEHNVNKRKYIK